MTTDYDLIVEFESHMKKIAECERLLGYLEKFSSVTRRIENNQVLRELDVDNKLPKDFSNLRKTMDELYGLVFRVRSDLELRNGQIKYIMGQKEEKEETEEKV